MRINALTKYNFIISKFAIGIFFLAYMAGVLFSAIISATLSPDKMAVHGASMGMISFAIFIVITMIIFSQKGTRFLITRSVSRKEIFAANAFFLVPLAAILSALQLASICIDGFVRWLFGMNFIGLKLDIQSFMAPDMSSAPVFFLVSLSLIICLGAITYLIGSLMARWKMPTICIVIILGLCAASLLVLPDYFKIMVKVLKFMLYDSETGLYICLKQLGLAAVMLAITFPIARRITAAK